MRIGSADLFGMMTGILKKTGLHTRLLGRAMASCLCFMSNKSGKVVTVYKTCVLTDWQERERRISWSNNT